MKDSEEQYSLYVNGDAASHWPYRVYAWGPQGHRIAFYFPRGTTLEHAAQWIQARNTPRQEVRT